MVLEELLPQELYYAFHLNVIRHGREVCAARTPRCDACVLAEVCAYALIRQLVSSNRGYESPGLLLRLTQSRNDSLAGVPGRRR